MNRARPGNNSQRNPLRSEEDEMATNKTRDKVEGKGDEAKGRVKEAAGALTGDESKRSEGAADQLKGKLKNKKGHLKDLVD